MAASVFSFAAIASDISTSAKPWTFWYWMYGAVSKEGVKADLEGMKEVGLGGAYLMPIRSNTEKPEYEGKAEQLTPEFWDMVEYSMSTADSLGLELGVHICDGFALAGGPWFTPEESMQKVVFTDTIVKYRKSITLAKPQGEGYRDISVYAFPVNVCDDEIKAESITVSDNVTCNDDGSFRANEECWIQYDFGTVVSPKALEVTPSGTNIQSQRLVVLSSENGTDFIANDTLVPARQGWQNTQAKTTFALKLKPARYYRLTWTPAGTEPGSEDLDAAKWKPTLRIKALKFIATPRIHQWEGKAAYAWRVAKDTDAYSAEDCVNPADILRLEIDENGVAVLPKKMKKGTWRILRMGHASTGQTNATAGGGKGLECDKFSAKAVNKLIDNWFARFNEMPSAKNVLKYLHVDSWECGCQNWSTTFAEEFYKRRGYDLLPYLPLMAGIPVESVEKSETVLRDLRTTINELINENFFATVRDRAHEMGMQFSSESIAPTMVSDGLDHYYYSDIPMGEYWLNSPTHDKPNDMLDAISGAHIYGKNIIQAEGFTEVRGVWDETPASIKTLLDRNFTLGMNKLFFHVNAHNPWMDRKPGMTLDGIGLFFQRDQTWYRESKPLVDYIVRCQTLLQQGHPVQDIAVFTGEEMPRRSILPERLVPMLPGIFGAERVKSEAERLANEGQPMMESPVGVNHSAGIVDTKDWVNCLRGYQYDSFNPDALLRLADVKDGCMTFPGGASYKVVVLPGVRPMNPAQKLDAQGKPVFSDAISAKIDFLRSEGVVIIDKPYTDEDFSKYGLERDVEVPCDIAYTHRTSNLGEVYFLSNQSEYGREISVSFRKTNNPKPQTNYARPRPGDKEKMEEWLELMKHSAETPYLYNPADNTLRQLVAENEDERTKVEINLDANGSAFVLFPASDDVMAMLAELPEKPRLITLTEGQSYHEVAVLKQFELTAEEMPMQPETVTLDFAAEYGSTIWNNVEKMQYFSGHATYKTDLTLKQVNGNEVLEFTKVADIAHVFVNGIDCGIAWTYPYNVEIGHALRKGKNTIEIKVVNTWANALRGMDEGTPPYSGIWTNAKYRMKTPHLIPAGLLLPPRITVLK